MSFKDLLSAGASAAWNSMKSKSEKISRYQERYEHLDDKQLNRKYRSASSPEEKIACANLIKARRSSSSDDYDDDYDY